MIIKPTRAVTHLSLELLGHSSDGDTKILSSHGAGIPLGRPVDKQASQEDNSPMAAVPRMKV